MYASVCVVSVSIFCYFHESDKQKGDVSGTTNIQDIFFHTGEYIYIHMLKRLIPFVVPKAIST